MPWQSRFRAGCMATPEAPLLSFVPVHFAVYRPLKPRLRWAMQCLVSFADHAGRCFPSLRTFAVQAGISKSAAGRDLAELEAEGHSPGPDAPAASTSTASPAASCRAGPRSRCPRPGIGSVRRGMPAGRRPH